MNETMFDKLVEISWRRRLTAEEESQLQAWLAGHPEDAGRWEMEAGLNRTLEKLETVVPASNFTSRVLQLVELDARASRRKPFLGERLRQWLWRPRQRPGWALAGGVLVVACTLGAIYHQQQKEAQATRVVRSLSTVVAMAPPDVLEDFDAIREFSHVRADIDETDEALFALLIK